MNTNRDFINNNFVPVRMFYDNKSFYDVRQYLSSGSPVAVILKPDRTEVDRITFYAISNPAAFKTRLEEINRGIDTWLSAKTEYERNPDNVKNAINYGRKLQRRYDSRDEALLVFTRLTLKHSSGKHRNTIIFGLAESYRIMMDRKNEYKVYEKGLNNGSFTGPTRYLVLSRMGKKHYNNLDFDSSISYLEQIPLDSLNFRQNESILQMLKTMILLPLAYQMTDRPDSARIMLEKIYDSIYWLDKSSKEVISSYTSRCLGANFAVDIAEKWQKSVLDKPDKSYTLEAIATYADLLEIQQRYDEAVTIRERYIVEYDKLFTEKTPKTESNRAIVQAHVAALYLFSGKNDEFRKNIDEMLTYVPDDQSPWYGIMRKFMKYPVISEETFRFLDHAARYFHQFRKKSESYDYYAQQLFHIGNYEKAVEMESKALELSPENEKFKANMAKFSKALKKK